MRKGRLPFQLGPARQVLYNPAMHRYRLGSRLLWLKGLAIGLYVGSLWWPGFARTPLERAIWGTILLALILWVFAGPLGYVDDKGVHYRKWIRMNHAVWPEVTHAEWSAEEMTLWVTVRGQALNFRYTGIAPVFGSRQRPEAINFIERVLTADGPPGRFVCKTRLTA